MTRARVNPTRSKTARFLERGGRPVRTSNVAPRCAVTRIPDRWSSSGDTLAGDRIRLTGVLPASVFARPATRRGSGPITANDYNGVAAVPQETHTSIVSEQHFTPEMTVDEAFKVHAGARRVFARFHLGGCSNCAISETHTIGAVSEDYGIPLPMLLESLNALFDQGTLALGDKVRIPDEIRGKIPQLADVPEIGQITGVESGAYTAEFGDVRLQGLAEDFVPVEASASVG